METLPCHPVLLSGGFPYLQDMQTGSGTFPICCSLTPLFPVNVCAQCCSLHHCSSMSLLQPNLCLESAAHSQAANGQLMETDGDLISIHLSHCYTAGKMAPRPFLAYPAPGNQVHSSMRKLRTALLTRPSSSDALGHS